MVSGIPSVGITRNECFLSCDTVLRGVRYVCMYVMYSICTFMLTYIHKFHGSISVS